MLWTEMGAPPPMTRLPAFTARVGFRGSRGAAWSSIMGPPNGRPMIGEARGAVNGRLAAPGWGLGFPSVRLNGSRSGLSQAPVAGRLAPAGHPAAAWTPPAQGATILRP